MHLVVLIFTSFFLAHTQAKLQNETQPVYFSLIISHTGLVITIMDNYCVNKPNFISVKMFICHIHR